MIQFSIRVPDDMHKQISESAKKMRRSLNAEIVTMLEEVIEKNSNYQKQGAVREYPSDDS